MCYRLLLRVIIEVNKVFTFYYLFHYTIKRVSLPTDVFIVQFSGDSNIELRILNGKENKFEMNRTASKLNSLCYKCTICNNRYKLNKTLRAHLNRRHGKKCPKCETSFRLYSELKKHLEEKHGSDGHVKRLDLNNIGENMPTYPTAPTIEMISHIEEIVSEGGSASESTKIIYNKKLIYNKYTEQIKMKTDTLLELINYVELDKHKTGNICNYLDMAIGELENCKNQYKQDKTFCKVSSRRDQTDSVVPLRESEGLPVKVLSVNNSVLNSCNLQNTKACFHYDHDYC